MNQIGVDIGGANLKAYSRGQAWHEPFALWKTPTQLPQHLQSLFQRFDYPAQVRITMTGELCDCYLSKAHGVRDILDAVQTAALPSQQITVWTTQGRFVDVQTARQQVMAVAASNWHALATFIGRQYPRGDTLLVDCGSTTTDLIPIKQGNVCSRGLTDTDRLAHDELVYLGVSRTPLMALGPVVGQMPVMAEHFATMMDVCVLLGYVPEDESDVATADARPRTREHAARRLVRMFGADPDMIGETAACRYARQFYDKAVGRLAEAIGETRWDQIILSGSGTFLAADAIQRLGVSCPVYPLEESLGADVSTAACAYALCQL